LGALLRDTGRSDEAEPMLRQAIRIHETWLGPKHPHVATALNNLALLLQATNRPQEAESMFRRAIEIYEVAFGHDHPKTQRVRRNLETLEQRQRTLPFGEDTAS